MDSYLKELEFKQLTTDPCIYMLSGGETFYIGVYVDDIILVESSEEKMQEVKDNLNQTFDLNDKGKLPNFLGLTVSQIDNDFWLGQPNYTSDLPGEKWNAGQQAC